MCWAERKSWKRIPSPSRPSTAPRLGTRVLRAGGTEALAGHPWVAGCVVCTQCVLPPVSALAAAWVRVSPWGVSGQGASLIPSLPPLVLLPFAVNRVRPRSPVSLGPRARPMRNRPGPHPRPETDAAQPTRELGKGERALPWGAAEARGCPAAGTSAAETRRPPGTPRRRRPVAGVLAFPPRRSFRALKPLLLITELPARGARCPLAELGGPTPMLFMSSASPHKLHAGSTRVSRERFRGRRPEASSIVRGHRAWLTTVPP